jgi:CRISPR-associated endonuclease Cas1
LVSGLPILKKIGTTHHLKHKENLTANKLPLSKENKVKKQCAFPVTKQNPKENKQTKRNKQTLLLHIEGKFSQFYFNQILQLFPEKLRPEHRIGFKAYDGVNNLFNLAYQVLFWKCYSALIKSKVEPYLGFLHSLQFGKPSLVCDFQELYRPLMDDFVIQFGMSLKMRDFKKFYVIEHGLRKYPRLYLNHEQNIKFRNAIYDYFKSIVAIPRIKVGKKQEFETLINEEALLFAEYLRDELKDWNPRIPIL